MKILSQKITAGLGLALALSLVSCEKESTLLTPSLLNGARVGAVEDNNLLIANLPQTPRLVKYGVATLSYADNGKLQKVTTVAPGGVIASYTDYTYAPGSIRAASYQGSSLVRDETFILDASGRCTESVIKGSSYDTYWAYYYNAQGQLASSGKKNTCVGAVSYTYGADGDMIKATVATSATSGTDIKFDYTLLFVDPKLYNDAYPLNLNVPLLPEHDTFLRIFGKMGKHLVRRVSYTPSPYDNAPAPSDRFYSYVLGSDGYVTERNMSYKLEGTKTGGRPVERTAYEYEMANIMLN